MQQSTRSKTEKVPKKDYPKLRKQIQYQLALGNGLKGAQEELDLTEMEVLRIISGTNILSLKYVL